MIYNFYGYVGETGKTICYDEGVIAENFKEALNKEADRMTDFMDCVIAERYPSRMTLFEEYVDVLLLMTEDDYGVYDDGAGICINVVI